jgi:hypothetical protein
MTTDPDAEFRRLRDQVARLEERDDHAQGAPDIFAIQEIGYLRAKLQVPRPTFQAAAPGSRRVDVDPVTTDELAAALQMLRQMRPLVSRPTAP